MTDASDAMETDSVLYAMAIVRVFVEVLTRRQEPLEARLTEAQVEDIGNRIGGLGLEYTDKYEGEGIPGLVGCLAAMAGESLVNWAAATGRDPLVELDNREWSHIAYNPDDD